MENKKINHLTNFFKLSQATEVKSLLLAVREKEQQLIKEGFSDNYDALEKLEHYIIHLTRDIEKGLLYIKKHGEEPLKNVGTSFN